MKPVRVKFNTKAFQNALTKELVEDQTNALLDYARQKILDIGNQIASYASGNHMDDSGNLLDSLCWGVTWKDQLKGYGFYRQQQATEESHLHTWFGSDISDLFPVYGHGLARQFIQQFAAKASFKGWQVFFAVLAPYWGYWEEGFKMRTINGERFMQFSVMTQQYDLIKEDLKPARTRFRVYVKKYNTNKFNNLQSLYKSVSENPWKERRHFAQFPKFVKPKTKRK